MTQSTNTVLLLHPDTEAPSRFAHIQTQTLTQFDMSPCTCGVPFNEHAWVLTAKDAITVLACSLENLEITLVVAPVKRRHEDRAHRSGLTEEAAELLGDVLQDAGFEIIEGPLRAAGER